MSNILPEKFLQVLKHEGVVAIATQGLDGRPHLVNTWNSYIQISSNEHVLVPMGRMLLTEKNVSENSAVLLTLGSREVAGNLGPGTGFLITGTAKILSSGVDFDRMKELFPWARAALSVAVESITQTL